jgi:hypothetical protein
LSIGNTQNYNVMDSSDEQNLSVPTKNLKRITTYVIPEIAQALEEWAKQEDRSVSWLAGKLIEKGIQEHHAQQQQSKNESKTEQ